jgi:transposase InsO family protein
MDVWSRRIVSWEIYDDEIAERAATLIQRICAESGIDPNGCPSDAHGATARSENYRHGLIVC